MRHSFIQKKISADFSFGLNDCLETFVPDPKPTRNFRPVKRWKIFFQIGFFGRIFADMMSSKILAVDTHRRVYKFDRLPLGVKVVPGIFQQAVDVMLGDLNFAIAYLDDIQIKSETHKQHIEHIHEVFKKISDFGFKSSEKKCDLFTKKITYLGHIIDDNSRVPW